MPGLARALFAWMDAAGLPDAHLLGNSFGCQVVAEAAVQQPGRVQEPRADGSRARPGDPQPWWSPVWRLLRWTLFASRGWCLPTIYDFWETGVGRVWGVFRACLADRIEDKLPGILHQPTCC